MLQFSSGAEHLKLAVVLFQNLFPPINVQTVKLGSCQVSRQRHPLRQA
jgi:ribosome biogenesis protein SSF1/2